MSTNEAKSAALKALVKLLEDPDKRVQIDAAATILRQDERV